MSVTDRCNLRCHYCMPEEDYVWLPREDLLTFEEIVQLADFFGGLGVDRLRITGGEPLLRRNLPELIAQLAERPWLRDLSLTTNGVLLAQAADELRRARDFIASPSASTRCAPIGFTGSRAWTRCPMSSPASRRPGAPDLPDSSSTRSSPAVTTTTSSSDLVEFAREVGAEIRFIEYMDVGGATEWRPDAVVSADEMLARLTEHYGPTRRDHRARLVSARRRGSASERSGRSASSRRRRSRSAARATARD